MMQRGRLPIVPLNEWPESHLKLWEEATHDDPDDPTCAGAAAHWTAKTVRTVRKAWGQYLSSTAERGGSWGDDEPPESRCDPESFRGFVERLTNSGVNSVTIASRIRDVREALRVMRPGFDPLWLKRGVRRAQAAASPTRNKRARLRHSRDLFAAGFQAMAEAEESVCAPAIQRAARYRDGLIVALVALRPIRLENLASLEIGRQITQVDGSWMLVLEPEELKDRGGPALEATIPDELTPALERYLLEWRPMLLRGRHSNCLWISIRGTPMSCQAIYQQVIRLTTDKFGAPLPPHMFRDCAASSIVHDDPTNAKIVARVLGQRTLKTGERHYIHAGDD
jgi:integrase/recombinase XerD